MSAYFCTDEKLSVFEQMAEGLPTNRKYEMYLCTAFIDENSTLLLVNLLSDLYKIKKITLLIDRSEIYKKGIETIKELQKKLRISISKKHKGEVNILGVQCSSGIFHSKAYAILYKEKSGSYAGNLLLGSANLTGKGLTAKNGNIETLYKVRSKKDLNAFSLELQALIENSSLNLLDIHTRATLDLDSFGWKHSLLVSGLFAHRWSDALSRELGIRYELSEKGTSLSNPGILKEMSFSMDSKTITKSYFRSENRFSHINGEKDFIKKHSIETYLGYWIPKGSLYRETSDEVLNKLKAKLESELFEQRDRIIAEIKNDYLRLFKEGIIKDKPGCEEKFSHANLNNLLEDQFKLRRILFKYEFFELPYNAIDQDHIINLYNELKTASDYKKSNHAIKMFRKAHNNINLSYLTESDLYYQE